MSSFYNTVLVKAIGKMKDIKDDFDLSAIDIININSEKGNYHWITPTFLAKSFSYIRIIYDKLIFIEHSECSMSGVRTLCFSTCSLQSPIRKGAIILHLWKWRRCAQSYAAAIEWSCNLKSFDSEAYNLQHQSTFVFPLLVCFKC